MELKLEKNNSMKWWRRNGIMVALVALILLLIPLNTNLMNPNETTLQFKQEIDDLKNSTDFTKKEVESLKVEISELRNKKPIDRYLDVESKDIIKDIIKNEFFELYWDSIFQYTTNAESLDGLTKSAGVGLLGGAFNLITTATGTNFQYLKRTFAPADVFNFSKESRFRIVMAADQIVTQNILITIGSTGHFFGFDIEDDVIRGTTRDGTTTKIVTLNKSINSTDLFLLEARFFPKNRVDFYVNGVQYGSSTINLPTTTSTTLWECTITEQAALAKTMWLYSVEYLQKK